jgi:archaellum component FlaC
MPDNVETIREQSSDLEELLPALTTMKEDRGGRLDSLHECIVELEDIEKGLDKRVADLSQEISTMRAPVEGLKGDVERITERLPDPNAPGPLERARDLLTGDD